MTGALLDMSVYGQELAESIASACSLPAGKAETRSQWFQYWCEGGWA